MNYREMLRTSHTVVNSTIDVALPQQYNNQQGFVAESQRLAESCNPLFRR
jgi:hypothetical protein